ncbi:transposase (plasmid) [Sinorhizobium americanum CCGM7]|nr:transposase [Sinorhizobium americanum CCGM7]
MAYLTDVSTRVVNGHPNSQIKELATWAYAEKTETKAWPETPFTQR